MKKMFLFLLLGSQVFAQENPLDILYFPKSGQVISITEVTSTNGELKGKLSGVNLSLTNKIDLLSEQLSVGLPNNFEAGIFLPFVSSGESKLKSNNTTVLSGDYKSGLKSPTLGARKRFELGEQSADLRIVYCPKGSDDNGLASDYYGIGASYGIPLEDQKINLSLTYTNYNSTDDANAQTSTGFHLEYQKNFSNLIVQAKAGLSQHSDSTSVFLGTKMKYSASSDYSLGIGSTIQNLNWLISYSFLTEPVDVKDYPSNANPWTATQTSNALSLQLGIGF